MNWFIRTEEGEFGPVSFDTVAAWARDARLLATDEIRPDAEDGVWTPAGEVAELGLVWRILFPDGDVSRPVHGETIVNSLQSGDFQPEWEVEDVRSGARHQIADVACALLLQQNVELRGLLEDAHARLAAGAEASGPAAAEEPASPGDWQRLVRELDFFKKEEAKLRKFLEDELARSRLREEQVQHTLGLLKANERAQEERINLISQSRDRMAAELNELRESIRSGSPDSEIISLRELALGNAELGRELARLQDRLLEYDRELQQALGQRAQAEELAREAARRADEQVAHERAEARKSREQLVRLEHKHREMLTAYRELSDRLIHMRNEALKSPRTEPAASAPSSPEAKPAAPGPRVKLF